MIAIVGGGGFIGKNLAEWYPSARVIERGDPLDFTGCDTVIHLAANADVRGGWKDPQLDIRSNLMLTSDVLEAMRKQKVKRLVFASTGSVYEPSTVAHKETDPLRSTSLYAASKIACEQLIAAYCEAGFVKATVLRLVSVLGPHYSHGLLIDFARKLRDDPTHMEVLFPASSQKSYVHVRDVCYAVQCALVNDLNGHAGPFEVYNVGTDETATPAQIARWITDKPILLTGETWVGDNPYILLDTTKLRSLGWRPQYTIRQAVEETYKYLKEKENGSKEIGDSHQAVS